MEKKVLSEKGGRGPTLEKSVSIVREKIYLDLWENVTKHTDDAQKDSYFNFKVYLLLFERQLQDFDRQSECSTERQYLKKSIATHGQNKYSIQKDTVKGFNVQFTMLLHEQFETLEDYHDLYLGLI